MVRIKICGVTTPEDARLASELGADAIGLNFYPQSPRFVSSVAAATIIRALPAFTVPIGVFVGMELRRVTAVAFQLGLRGVQTYENHFTSEDTFPFAFIPAFRVRDNKDLDAICRFLDAARDRNRTPAAILIDSHVEGKLGGTGHRAPWELIANYQLHVPVILAGGLTPENVAEAIALVEPWAVDVASGVEASPGHKDPSKIAYFVENARKAAKTDESR